MFHRNSLTSIKLVFSLSALLMNASANALLIDCTQSLAAELHKNGECIATATASVQPNDNAYSVDNGSLAAAIPVMAEVRGFQVSQADTSETSGPAPLIGLVCTLLVALLIRTKSFNTK